MHPVTFRSAARTDTGPARAHNEDEVICDDSLGLYAVIDGMGGQAAGEVAARIAKNRVLERMRQPGDALERKVCEAIALANNTIFEEAHRNPEWAGMGCVMTVAVLAKDRLTVGHVGDSRLYRIAHGADLNQPSALGMRKLTHDHSPVGEREDSGQLSEEEAIRHPRRNEVFRDVGSERHAPEDSEFVEVLSEPADRDAAFLLCSDGLTDVVRRAGMLDAIRRHAGDPEAVTGALIELANANSKDNVTVVYLEGPRFAAALRKRSRGTGTGEAQDQFPDSDGPADGPHPAAPPPRTASRRFWWAWPAACLLFASALGYVMWSKSGPPPPRRIAVGPGVSIADALAQSRPGDLIDVAAGTYTGRIRLKSGVDLLAATPGRTVLQAETPVIEATGVSNVRLVGFTVTPLGGRTAAIEIAGSDVQMLNLDISGSPAAGVRFSEAATGLLTGSYLHHNAGAGVEIDGMAEPRITANLFAANGSRPGDPQPSVLVRSSAQPVIRGNWFAESGAEPVWARTDVPVPGLDENFFQTTPKQRRIRLLPPLR